MFGARQVHDPPAIVVSAQGVAEAELADDAHAVGGLDAVEQHGKDVACGLQAFLRVAVLRQSVSRFDDGLSRRLDVEPVDPVLVFALVQLGGAGLLLGLRAQVQQLPVDRAEVRVDGCLCELEHVYE